MENLTKEILAYLKNEHTNVQLKEDFKGNYYSYLVDTIYISQNLEDKMTSPKNKEFNKKAAQLIVICHECIHSVQSRYMHILNMILSNLSIILTTLCAFWGILWTSPLWIKTLTISTLILSIIIRLILEIQAVKGSTKLALKFISNGITDKDIQYGVDFIEKYKYIEFFRMIIDKIVCLILVLVIK